MDAGADAMPMMDAAMNDAAMPQNDGGDGGEMVPPPGGCVCNATSDARGDWIAIALFLCGFRRSGSFGRSKFSRSSGRAIRPA